uniref:SFRICE_028505 n=1 Tax=Spodoptera frugiperda TaxID=7108 RepID=A0A2H1VWS3_SPOFR
MPCAVWSAHVLAMSGASQHPETLPCAGSALYTSEIIETIIRNLMVIGESRTGKIAKGGNWASGNLTHTTKYNASDVSRRYSVRPWYHSGRLLPKNGSPTLNHILTRLFLITR